MTSLPPAASRFLDYPCALVPLAALLGAGSAPGGPRNHPVVEPLAALAERVLLALVRARDETAALTPKPTFLRLIRDSTSTAQL